MSEKDIKKTNKKPQAQAKNAKNEKLKDKNVNSKNAQTSATQTTPSAKNETERVSYDAQGNVIPEAYPVSNSTLRDQSKTSVGYTAFSIILYILAILPLIGVTVFLAIKTYSMLPAYGFWHFIAVVVVAVFGLIFALVTIIVTRKKSKSSIFSQTAKVAVTYIALTTVFGMILTYVVPDIIAYFTSSTLFAEDLFYNADEQIEKNASIERDFIMYNLLNGNLNEFDESGENIKTIQDEFGNTVEVGDFSYTTLSKRKTSPGSGAVIPFEYENEEINDTFNSYLMTYGNGDTVGSTFTKDQLQQAVIDPMKEDDPTKYELYEFIYTNYVLNDYTYALENTFGRRALALSILDFEYNRSNYTTYLKEGFGNKRLKALFDSNYDSFNQDGYNTFDDPLLLYAQLEGRMTIPVVLRLILNEGWSYTQGAVNIDGQVEYADTGELLYQLYDRATVDAFEEGGGTYDAGRTTLVGFEGEFEYGRNEDGWLIFKNGYVKRPMNWMVLDMLGDPMAITSLDLSTVTLLDMPLTELLSVVFGFLNGLTDSVGGLLNVDVSKLVEYATNGANIGISICINDNNALDIAIVPTNIKYGMLGYQWATWMQSNNLLMAVLNVMNVRNWLFIFGGVGVLLIAAAGVLRECGRRTRERTEVSRDRIMRANAVESANQAEKGAKGKKKGQKTDIKAQKNDKNPPQKAKNSPQKPVKKQK